MNRIERRFQELKAAGRTGLIPFVTAGDPLPEEIPALMHALVEAGSDLIELGVPFSDPMADGPVIQLASERALAAGVHPGRIFEAVAEFRRRDADTPVVLMGYLNPVECYGARAFARDAAAAGVDGLLLVDAPLGEEAIARPLAEAGLARILLAAPTSDGQRLAALSAAGQGFLYHVAFAGVTGADRMQLDELRERVAASRKAGDLPVAIGFGIRDGATAAALGEFADAVVVGSALVAELAGAADTADQARRAHAFMAPLRAALDAPAA